jgi:hypothetical protein
MEQIVINEHITITAETITLHFYGVSFPISVTGLFNISLMASKRGIVFPNDNEITKKLKQITLETVKKDSSKSWNKRFWVIRGMRTKHPHLFLSWFCGLGLSELTGLHLLDNFLTNDSLKALEITSKITKDPIMRLTSYVNKGISSENRRKIIDNTILELRAAGFPHRECGLIYFYILETSKPYPVNNLHSCQKWLSDHWLTWQNILILKATLSSIENNVIAKRQICMFLNYLRRQILEGKIVPLDSISFSDDDFALINVVSKSEKKALLKKVASALITSGSITNNNKRWVGEYIQGKLNDRIMTMEDL